MLRQVGNAVPPPMAAALMAAVRERAHRRVVAHPGLYDSRRSHMRPGSLALHICALSFGGLVFVSPALQAQSPKPTPLILQADEGERRVWRPI